MSITFLALGSVIVLFAVMGLMLASLIMVIFLPKRRTLGLGLMCFMLCMLVGTAVIGLFLAKKDAAYRSEALLQESMIAHDAAIYDARMRSENSSQMTPQERMRETARLRVLRSQGMQGPVTSHDTSPHDSLVIRTGHDNQAILESGDAASAILDHIAVRQIEAVAEQEAAAAVGEIHADHDLSSISSATSDAILTGVAVTQADSITADDLSAVEAVDEDEVVSEAAVEADTTVDASSAAQVTSTDETHGEGQASPDETAGDIAKDESTSTDNVATGDASSAEARTAAVAADNRPEWVVNPPDRVADNFALVLVSDPFDDRFGCDADLRRRTEKAIMRYARNHYLSLGHTYVPPVDVSPDDINSAARVTYYTLRPTSLGDMNVAYQLTVFDEDFNTRLEERLERAVVDKRIAAAGVVTGGILMSVAAAFGIFNFASRNTSDPLST